MDIKVLAGKDPNLKPVIASLMLKEACLKAILQELDRSAPVNAIRKKIKLTRTKAKTAMLRALIRDFAILLILVMF